MPDTIEQLKIDTEDIRDRGQSCDRLVLRAIALGYGTRRELKGLLGFGYDAIEKALEREAGAIRSRSVGQIERFELVSENGNGASKATPFNRPMSEKKPPQVVSTVKASGGYVIADSRKETELTCESCGGSRSPGSGRTCRTCYEGAAAEKRSAKKNGGRPRVEINRTKAKALRAEGKNLHETAEALGVNYWTLRDHVAQDAELREAMEEGRRLWVDARNAKRKEMSPVGYIKEKKEPSTGAVSAWLPEPSAPVVKVPTVGDDCVAELVYSSPKEIMQTIRETDAKVAEAILNTPNYSAAQGGTKIRLRYGDILLECDTPEEAASIIHQMRPVMPKTVKRAWSREFESDNTEDGTVGLTYLYLVSMLHDGMEEHEKEAVWVLIRYLKRMQAQAEQEKELNAKKN